MACCAHHEVDYGRPENAMRVFLCASENKQTNKQTKTKTKQQLQTNKKQKQNSISIHFKHSVSTRITVQRLPK